MMAPGQTSLWLAFMLKHFYTTFINQEAFGLAAELETPKLLIRLF